MAEYVSVKISDTFAVNGIYTLFKRDFDVTASSGGIDVHDFPEIIYMTSGSRRLVIDGLEKELCAGQIIMYAPGSPHGWVTPGNCSIAIVSFDCDLNALSPLYNRPITLNGKQRNLLDEIFDDGCKCFKSRIEKSELHGMVLTDDADERTLYGIKKRLELFLVDILKSEGEKNASKKSTAASRDFDEVLRFLRARVEETLTVNEIADGCGMSVSKLKYLFRDNYGGGVIDCFNTMKIERAKELIRKRELNFSEIAESLSFKSLHYFSRYFKKSTGMTPSEYLKRN